MKTTWKEAWLRGKETARQNAMVLSPGQKVWIAGEWMPGMPYRSYAARVITHFPKKYREDRYLIEVPDGRTFRVKRSDIWAAAED